MVRRQVVAHFAERNPVSSRNQFSVTPNLQPAQHVMPFDFNNDRPLEEWEYPDPDDSDDDGCTGTITCTACGAEIYEDAPQCPVCSEYATPGGGSLWQGRPGWWIVLGLLGIVAVIYMLVGL